MLLRNLLVRPSGLPISDEDFALGLERKGMFPVLSQSEQRIVLKQEDCCLDFRPLVELKELCDGRYKVSATTLVKPHNLLRLVYICAVMTLHKSIVSKMMARAIKP